MKANLSLITYLLFGILTPISAQIKGVVNDIDSNPLEYVNVALYSLSDTTLVGGAVTDSLGNFIIYSHDIDNTYLQVSMLGYETQKSKTQSFQIIILEPSSEYLDELIVEGERPALRVEQGKLIYHAPSLLKNKPINNAYDAIKEIPGVVEQDNKLSLIGTNVITVLLNGKKTSMSYQQLITLLQSTPLSRIEDIEIMYNAPPQYNIRGAAINVVLKQKHGEDRQNILQGEVAGEYQQQTHTSANGRINLLFIGKHITLDALYSNRYDVLENREDRTNAHTVKDELHYINEQNKGISRSNTHNVRTAMSATLINKDKVDVAYTGMFSNTKADRIADIYIDNINTNSDMHTRGPSTLHNVKADYTSHFGLTAGLDYTNFDEKSDQNLQNTTPTAIEIEERYTSNSNQIINRVFVYANQKHTLANDLSINYGLNYSYATTRNNSESFRNDESYIPSTFHNNQYENILNGFVSMSKTFSQQFSLQASFAAEYYKTVEKSDNKKQVLWDGIDYFPTLGANYTPSDNHILQFSLSSDKDYPPYWALNSTIYHLNAYNEIHGNPQLKPSRSYNTRLNYIFKRKYVLMAFINYSPDYFTQMFYQRLDEIQSEIKFHNLNYQRTLGFAAIAPFNVGKVWDSRITINGVRLTQKKDDFYDIPFNRSVWYGRLKWDNGIKLSTKPNINLNITGVYTTPAIQGIMNLGKSYYVSGGVTWSFNQEHARLILNATDIFNTRMPFVKTDFKGQKSTMKSFQDTRMVSLSFIYRLGGFKENKGTGIDISRYGVQ